MRVGIGLAAVILASLLFACEQAVPGPNRLPTLVALATAPLQQPPKAEDDQPQTLSSPTASDPVSAAVESVVTPGSVDEVGADGGESEPMIQNDGLGLRPGQVVLQRNPDSGEEPPVEWRPPPVPVPYSLHPDDHYWLARPIASDRRNYDLTWYHYGNRPMRSEALPYRVHHGLDFPNETGTPIFAASSGTVVWAGPLRSNRDGVNYYGNTVIIKHDWQWREKDVYTLYAHTLELFVEVGDQVDQGQLIAGVGASGEVSGPHLHLEVRVGDNNYANTVNPALWLAPYEGWGTLAGRFMDNRGEPIHGAQLTIIPVNVVGDLEVPIQRQRTYEPSTVNPDEVWQENFVVADLPAGEYRVILVTAGETFRRTVTIQPGQTNYIIVQADFNWAPTATPTPTPTAAPTALPTLAVTPTP